MSIKSKLKSILDNSDCIEVNKLSKHHYYRIDETFNEDIFIAGYPKSGNTWMQHLMSGLIFGINPKFMPDRLSQELVPDLHHKVIYKRYLDRCFFKTHSRPKPKYKNVIHLVRDGRDVMASYYAMKKKMNENISLEEMILEGRGLFPCKWYLHTREWVENPYNARICTIKYEDLLTTPEACMANICNFLNIERQDELIKKVIEGCKFESMRKKEKKFGLDNPEWPSNQDFIRKGKQGTYKEDIQEDLLNIFEEEAKEMLEYFSYM